MINKNHILNFIFLNFVISFHAMNCMITDPNKDGNNNKNKKNPFSKGFFSGRGFFYFYPYIIITESIIFPTNQTDQKQQQNKEEQQQIQNNNNLEQSIIINENKTRNALSQLFSQKLINLRDKTFIGDEEYPVGFNQDTNQKYLNLKEMQKQIKNNNVAADGVLKTNSYIFKTNNNKYPFFKIKATPNENFNNKNGDNQIVSKEKPKVLEFMINNGETVFVTNKSPYYNPICQILKNNYVYNNNVTFNIKIPKGMKLNEFSYEKNNSDNGIKSLLAPIVRLQRKRNNAVFIGNNNNIDILQKKHINSIQKGIEGLENKNNDDDNRLSEPPLLNNQFNKQLQKKQIKKEDPFAVLNVSFSEEKIFK
jgi:hypothetical protein